MKRLLLLSALLLLAPYHYLSAETPAPPAKPAAPAPGKPAPAPPAPADKTTKDEKDAQTKRAAQGFYGEVTAVDAKKQTLVVGGKTYVVVKGTVIHNGEAPALFTDVVAGKKVGGSYTTRKDGKRTLQKLNVGVKQEAAPDSTPSPKTEKKAKASPKASAKAKAKAKAAPKPKLPAVPAPPASEKEKNDA